MNFKHHLETAWRLTLKNIVPLILMTLVMTLVTVFSFGLLGMVVLAGYCQAILLMIRENRTPVIGDLFAQMHLFLPMLVFGILLIIVSAIGFSLFYLPGVAVLCFVTFACLYMLPLMADRKMQLLDAIKQSWQMAVRGNIADHVVVVILYIGFLAIGGSVFLGTLLTQPFATVFVLSVYLERMAGEETPMAKAGDENSY